MKRLHCSEEADTGDSQLQEGLLSLLHLAVVHVKLRTEKTRPFC